MHGNTAIEFLAMQVKVDTNAGPALAPSGALGKMKVWGPMHALYVAHL